MTGIAEEPRQDGTTGPLPYPYAPQPKAPSGLAVATITVSVVVALLQVAVTGLLWATDEDDEQLVVLAARALVGLLTGVALVAAWILTALWLHACRSNLDRVPTMMQHARSPVWAWLGWIVPIVSFWFPYQFVRDLQDAGRREQGGEALGLWWTGWLVYLLFSRADSSPVASTIATLGLLAALGPWIRIVLGLTADQEHLLELR